MDGEDSVRLTMDHDQFGQRGTRSNGILRYRALNRVLAVSEVVRDNQLGDA